MPHYQKLREMMQLLTEEKSAIKVFVEVKNVLS
jgi:hypothetical protein